MCLPSLDLYTKCPVCVVDFGTIDTDSKCPVCNGDGFTKAGVSTKQVANLADGNNRAKHTDKYFEAHPEQMKHFIDWLRENPYPPQG